jgi:ribosome-binding factor A
MQGRRIDRIEEQLRIELSEIIEREIQDPRIGLTTVTAVKVTPDRATPGFLVTVPGDAAQRKKAPQGLGSAASFVRRSRANACTIHETDP